MEDRVRIKNEPVFFYKTEKISLVKLANSSKQNFILSLPSELRLIIYEFAVIERVTGPRTCPSSSFILSLVPPNLARVNRQLRQEVRPVYYRGNEFWVQLPTCQDHIRDSFFAQCMIAVDFLPLIRSLRCEVYLVPSRDWSIVFQTAASAPTSEGKDSEDWKHLSRNHDAYC